MPHIRLLSNTGIQFVRLEPVPEASLRKPTIKLSAVTDEIKTELEAELIRPSARTGPGNEDDDGPPRSPDRAVSIGPFEIADRIRRRDDPWVPLPMNSSQTGMWAMLWIGRCFTDKEKKQEGFELVLAVDTTTTEGGVGGTLSAKLPQRFGVEPFRPVNFWQSPAIREYVRGLVVPSDPKVRTEGRVQAQVASLYAFIQPLLPDLTISDPPASTDVDVTLVVDLGNSRTCAVLIEDQQEKPPRLTQLKLRRTDRPHVLADGPFPTRLAFVKAGFGVLSGNVVRKLSLASGEQAVSEPVATFADLSVVRLGDEALDLLDRSQRDREVCGMSSPKRYMWDREQRVVPWQLAADGGAADGPLLRRLNPANPLDVLGPSVTKLPNFTGCKHPRLCGTTLLFVELLEHAFRQINEQLYRGDDPGGYHSANANRRRVIRDVVLMHPAGMHSMEVQAIRTSVGNAAGLWAHFRNDPIGFREGRDSPATAHIPTPTEHIACDEGLAIQTCFVYDEWRSRFVQDTGLLLDACGSPRAGKQTLRIASIDIGGGTIDVAIADYSAFSQAAAPTALEVRKLFHDGISRAGDDVVEHLLTNHLFPAIADFMGVSERSWNELFRVDSSAAADPTWQQSRIRLVNDVWLPAAYECLRRFEAGEDVECKLEELLLHSSSVNALTELGRRLATSASGSTGGTRLTEAPIQINENDFANCVSEVLKRAVAQYCDIIGQYACDVLVVGGRAAASPTVHRLILDHLPVPPGSVFMLHGRRFAEWFPFSGGPVVDAKTCAVVGAAVAFRAAGNMFDLFLHFEPGDDRPVDILGVYNNADKSLYATAVLRPNDTRWKLMLINFSQMILGARRIDSVEAAARPIFRLTLKKRLLDRISRGRRPNEAIEVTLERRPDSGDDLKVEHAVGQLRFAVEGQEDEYIEVEAEDVSCRLQTMVHQDYWLDDGCFAGMENDKDALNA